MAADHSGGRSNYVNEINAVLTLEAVKRLLFRELPRKVPGDLVSRTAVRELSGSIAKPIA